MYLYCVINIHWIVTVVVWNSCLIIIVWIHCGYGPLYNTYKCCLGVCLATCRSLNNVYTATSICMARNTVRPVHHLDCWSTDHFKCWAIQLLDNYFYSGVTLTTFIMTITFNNQCDFKGICCQAYYNMWYAVNYKCKYKKCKHVIMQVSYKP